MGILGRTSAKTPGSVQIHPVVSFNSQSRDTGVHQREEPGQPAISSSGEFKFAMGDPGAHWYEDSDGVQIYPVVNSKTIPRW